MDPAAGANAVAHLDHNLGTRTRQWSMAHAMAEHLCAKDTGFCTKKVRVNRTK